MTAVKLRGVPAIIAGRRANPFIRQAALTGTFFSACASAILGSVMVNTPLAKFASILSAMTPSGTRKERTKEP
jgi:hypothetical protein